MPQRWCHGGSRPHASAATKCQFTQSNVLILSAAQLCIPEGAKVHVIGQRGDVIHHLTQAAQHIRHSNMNASRGATDSEVCIHTPAHTPGQLIVQLEGLSAQT
jgi:hypothetical protein